MIKVDQTTFGTEGNCYSACLASILELSILDVPCFINKKSEWFNNVNDWLEKNYKMGMLSVPIPALKNSDMNYFFNMTIKKEPYNIIWGFSYEETVHACVGKGKMIVHDPHPRKTGLKKILYHNFLINLF
jgi:hypothetical protein